MKGAPEARPERRERAHVRIEGLVQGVGYRAWCATKAESLGLTGWVRNRRDGSVEALFEGEPELVARMLDLCRDGPPAARVDRMAPAEELAGRLDVRGFEVLPTV